MTGSQFRWTIGGALLAAALTAAGGAGADTTYQVNRTISSDTLTGSITTDGNSGALSGSDVLSWDVLLAGPSTLVELTPANSAVTVNGQLFQASGNKLLFDFLGPPGWFLDFQQTSGDAFYCADDNSAPCPDGETIAPSSGTAATFQPGSSQVIGVEAPEPSSWALMILAFGLLGGVLRATRRSRSAPAAA
ncbi:MAG TPA: PEP-CTERM sorting domain-containing protein [Caulobacteraceae bacterium]|nr:PEP-CTERM sorting domain-containing protein [Caulobacteraceae bacterium]